MVLRISKFGGKKSSKGHESGGFFVSVKCGNGKLFSRSKVHSTKEGSAKSVRSCSALNLPLKSGSSATHALEHNLINSEHQLWQE